MTVNMAEIRKIERALSSLKKSTDLEVSLRGETVYFSGLNSPYLSHRTVEIEAGHEIPRLVVFRNRHYSVAVFPYYHGNLRVEGDFIQVKLPAYHFAPLFHFPASPPHWFKGLVQVVIPDRFQGFDSNGKPRFKDRLFSHCTISATVDDEWGDGKRQVFLLDPIDWETIGEIGCATIRHTKFEGEHCFSWQGRVARENEPFWEGNLRGCESKYYKKAVELLAPFNCNLSPLCSFDNEECDEKCDGCLLHNWWVIHQKENHEHLCARFADLVAKKKEKGGQS